MLCVLGSVQRAIQGASIGGDCSALGSNEANVVKR